MKKTLLVLLAAVGMFIPRFASAQEADSPFVHCLILDKTLSMTGHGGTDIWDDVQKYCSEWVDGVSVGSKLLFFTYDRDLYGPQEFSIDSEADKEKVRAAIKGVVVDGRYTWIASNLAKVVDIVYDKYPDNNKMIYLITDGKEEQPGSDFSGTMGKYTTKRGDYDHLYYVDLRGSADEATKTIVENTPGADIGKGLVKFVTLRPELSTVNYSIGRTNQLVQRFVVVNGEASSDLSFNIKVESAESREEGKTPNVSISPSMNVTFDKLQKIEDGKYQLALSLDFLNNSECECDVNIILQGNINNDKSTVFNPSGFVIKAAKQSRVVNVKNGGWR